MHARAPTSRISPGGRGAATMSHRATRPIHRSGSVRRAGTALLAATALLLCGGALAAQKQKHGRGKDAVTKKLYCWEQDGQKVCGDSLPPGAVDLARTEYSAGSGRRTGELPRAMTDEERAAAASAEKRAEAKAGADAARERRDLAMVESYASEADLRRAYGERIALVDSAIKTSVLGEANLRASLVSLLKQASSKELAGQAVPKPALATIRSQHADLLRQQRILAQQRKDRAALDGELARALERYRDMKGAGQDAAAEPSGQ